MHLANLPKDESDHLSRILPVTSQPTGKTLLPANFVYKGAPEMFLIFFILLKIVGRFWSSFKIHPHHWTLPKFSKTILLATKIMNPITWYRCS